MKKLKVLGMIILVCLFTAVWAKSIDKDQDLTVPAETVVTAISRKVSNSRRDWAAVHTTFLMTARN